VAAPADVQEPFVNIVQKSLGNGGVRAP
jgi:hypothetical protein